MTESWSGMACTIEIDHVRSPRSGLRYCITVSSEPVGNRVELADDADAAGAATGFAHDGAGRLTQPSTSAGQPIDLDYDRVTPPLSHHRRPRPPRAPHT